MNTYGLVLRRNERDSRVVVLGPAATVADADNVTVTTREVVSILGYGQEEAWYLSGLMKYKFLQLLGITIMDDKLAGEGVFVGELIAYAIQLIRS